MSGDQPGHDPWATPSTQPPPAPPASVPPAPGPAAENPSPYLRPATSAPSYGVPTYEQPPYPPPSYAAPAPADHGTAQYGYGYGYPTYVPLRPDGPRRTDPVSVVALVCGCLLLAPLAFILGIVGVVRTRRPDLGGRGLAIAGIVLGVVGGLLGMVVAASVLFARSDVGQDVIGLASGDRVYVGDLAAGDCFQEPADPDSLLTVDTIDCSLPHDLEVMTVDTAELDDLAGGGPYPGQDTVADGADRACQRAFETFVGIAYDDSDLDFFTIYPSMETWEREQDRSVTCSVGDPDGQTTGTLEGARR